MNIFIEPPKDSIYLVTYQRYDFIVAAVIIEAIDSKVAAIKADQNIREAPCLNGCLFVMTKL